MTYIGIYRYIKRGCECRRERLNHKNRAGTVNSVRISPIRQHGEQGANSKG
jgi:hypothetical protein